MSMARLAMAEGSDPARFLDAARETVVAVAGGMADQALAASFTARWSSEIEAVVPAG